MIVLPHTNDVFKCLSHEQYKLDHDATRKNVVYERSPLPHVVQSSTGLAKCLTHPFHMDHKAGQKAVNKYHHPLALGVGGKFGWIPPLNDEKDIIRSKWPQERECVPPFPGKYWKVKRDIGVTLERREQKERENETFEQRNVRIGWRESHMMSEQKTAVLLEQNMKMKHKPKLEYNPDQLIYRPLLHTDKVETWDRLKVKWNQMQISTPNDDWVMDAYHANPIPSPDVQLFQSIQAKQTKFRQQNDLIELYCLGG